MVYFYIYWKKKGSSNNNFTSRYSNYECINYLNIAIETA